VGGDTDFLPGAKARLGLHAAAIDTNLAGSDELLHQRMGERGVIFLEPAVETEAVVVRPDGAFLDGHGAPFVSAGAK
jgi:hypothetical protein